MDGFTAKLSWLGGPEQDDFSVISCAKNTTYLASAKGCAPAAGFEAQDLYGRSGRRQ